MPPRKKACQEEEPDPDFESLDLPILVVEKMLNKMTPLEVINYSTRSEKCLEEVKKVFYQHDVSLDIELTKSKRQLARLFTLKMRDIPRKEIFIVHKNRTWCSDDAADANINGKTVPIIQEFHSMETFWENPDEGFMAVANLIRATFNKLQVRDVVFADGTHDARVTIEWMKSNGLATVSSCKILYKDAPCDDQIKYILENIHITSDLHIDITHVNKNKTWNLPDHLKRLELNCDKQISLQELENLFSLDQENLRCNFVISDDEVTDFITKCLNSEYPKLTSFMFQTQLFERIETMADRVGAPWIGGFPRCRFPRADGKFVVIQHWYFTSYILLEVTD